MRRINGLFAGMLLLSLSCEPTNPVQPAGVGGAQVTIVLGPVGSLAKRQTIQLDTLTVTLSADGVTPVVEKIAMSGNGQQSITKTYGNLAAPKLWTVAGQTKDKTGKTIHSGTTTFTVAPLGTATVGLDLSAGYSMVKANFFPIRDSVSRCKLLIDGVAVRDSSFNKRNLTGDTVKLTYDYLSASPYGDRHAIRLDARGIIRGVDTLLYTGDTVINVVSGQNLSLKITLKWIGPIEALPGQATMIVVIGTIGTVSIDGNLENPGIGQFAQLAAGGSGANHSMVIKKDRTLWACGFNGNGQLGDGTTTNHVIAIQVMSGVQSVALGWSNTMILTADGSLWGCGRNSYGQIGDGTTTERHSPVQVMSGIGCMAVGSNHTLIVKSDGTLWSCGNNDYGQLGNGTINSQALPAQIMSGVQSVSAGLNHSMILKTDGTLWACGDNTAGQLCNGSINVSPTKTPVQVQSGVQSVTAGFGHTIFLKDDGTLWACGYNQFGQLGDGTTSERDAPIQVMTNVLAVSTGYDHTMILKADSTLWACGDNRYGQLGDGTTTAHLSPVQIMSGVGSVAAEFQFTTILKNDGTLWVCGRNANGQLGDGTSNDRGYPEQIYY